MNRITVGEIKDFFKKNPKKTLIFKKNSFEFTLEKHFDYENHHDLYVVEYSGSDYEDEEYSSIDDFIEEFDPDELNDYEITHI